MGLFSGCMLACDIDGTLMINGKINPRNIEKIDFFINEGGLFSISTGRSAGAVGPVLRYLKNVSPSVVANGCMLYDFENDCVLDELFIDRDDYRIAEKVLKMGLNVGIEVHRGKNVFNLYTTKETIEHQEYEWIRGREISYEEACGYGWNKIVYIFDSLEELAAVKQMISEEKTVSVFVETSAEFGGRRRNYYEQFPKEVSKYSALCRLCKITGIKKGGLFAMGDYYNDLEMIKNADISAVPAGTPADISSFADYIAGPCEDGAVADFIEYLTKVRKEW